MEAEVRPRQTEEIGVIDTRNWSHEYYYIGTIAELRIFKGLIELRLSERPEHVWLGWEDPALGAFARNMHVKGLRRGDKVRIDFRHCEHGLGIHHLQEIRPIGLLLRQKVKIRFWLSNHPHLLERVLRRLRSFIVTPFL